MCCLKCNQKLKRKRIFFITTLRIGKKPKLYLKTSRRNFHLAQDASVHLPERTIFIKYKVNYIQRCNTSDLTPSFIVMPFSSNPNNLTLNFLINVEESSQHEIIDQEGEITVSKEVPNVTAHDGSSQVSGTEKNIRIVVCESTSLNLSSYAGAVTHHIDKSLERSQLSLGWSTILNSGLLNISQNEDSNKEHGTNKKGLSQGL